MMGNAHPFLHRIVVVVLAAACALIFSLQVRSARSDDTVPAANVVTVAPPDEVDQLTRRFQSNLRNALDQGEASRRRWPKLSWKAIECYEPRSVRRTLERAKSDITDATSDPKLAALQSYVQARLDTIGRMPPTMLITQPGFLRGTTVRVPGVRTDQADTAWSELREFVESFLASARLAVDVSVASEPSGAKLELQAGSSAVNRLTLATSCQLRNVWRGLYRVNVEKPGYKGTSLDLDLVNQGSLAVTCTLAKAGDVDDSRCSFAALK